MFVTVTIMHEVSMLVHGLGIAACMHRNRHNRDLKKHIAHNTYSKSHVTDCNPLHRPVNLLKPCTALLCANRASCPRTCARTTKT